MNNIFHIDMDAFFASIEILQNKYLQNKPIAVSGRKKESIISSTNYIAREYGIKAAMPLFIAKKICPNLIVIDINQERMNNYNKISKHIFEMLKRKLTTKVEIGSIDEWYIDVINTKLMSLPEEEIIYLIKKEIKDSFHLNCTVGCSYNKFFAKMATNISKPNGSLIIDKINYKTKLWNLKIEKMQYVGNKAIFILKNKNIKTIGDLANYTNDKEMISLLGNKWLSYKKNANGCGSNVLNLNNDAKSIGKSVTFYNEKLKEEILTELYNMSNQINVIILEKKLEFKTINVSIKLWNEKIISKCKTNENYSTKINLNAIQKILEDLLAKSNVHEIKVCNLNVSNIKQKFLINIQQDISMFINDNDKKIHKKIDTNDLIINLNKKFCKKIFYSASEKRRN